MTRRTLPVALIVALAGSAGAEPDPCDREGYRCEAGGFEPPSVEGASRTWSWVLYKDGHRVDLQRYDFPRGRYVYGYRAGGRTYAWVEIGGASTGYLDADCDGVFEAQLSAGADFTVPACTGKPQVTPAPDAHCNLPGYECRDQGWELPAELGRYREMPIRLYLRQLGVEREQAHLVEGNGLRKSMCGHKVGRETLVRVSGDGRNIRLIRYLHEGAAWTVTLVAEGGETITLVDSDGDGDYDTRVGDGVVIPCPDHVERS
jgi:hypothetical protein